MAIKVDDVSDVNNSKDTWNIVTKVVRLWVSPSFSGGKLPFSMELVLMDSKGCQIHASVRKTLVYRFHPLLTEGRVYQISYFGVGDNLGDFRTTTHQFKINFHIHTKVKEIGNCPITKSPYSFISLSEIMFNDPDPSYLIDIIGILTGSSGEQEYEKDGKIQKRVTIELFQDGVRLECAFFGNYVGQILGQLAAGDMTNAVVVVQYAKIKPFRWRPSVQNVYGATKILFNPDVEEAEPLRARYFELNDPATQVLSQLESSARVSITEEFLSQTEGKFIEQIRDLAEKTTCVVLATIKFIPEGHPWWYRACKCNKKAISADGMFFCENCVRHLTTPIPRYKLQVRVMDHSESTTFVIFDQETSALLNRPCSSFVDDVTKDPADYPIPPEILALIDKTFLFKIEVNNSSNSKFEPSYRVKKICSDEDVIAEFKSTLVLPNGNNLYLIESTPTSVLRGESSSSSFSKNLAGEFGMAEDSPTGPIPNAPAVDLGRGKQVTISPHAVDIPNRVPTGTTTDLPINIQKTMDDQAVVDDSPGFDVPISQSVVPIAALVKKQVNVVMKTSGKKSSDGFPDDGVQAVVYDSDAPAVDVPNQDPTGTTADVPINIQKYAVDQAVVHDSPGFDVPVSQSVVPIAALVKKQVKVVKKTNGKKSSSGFEVDGDSPPVMNFAEHGDSVNVETVESPPLKRPSPPCDEPLGSSNVVKKPLKVVKKEKM